MAVILCVCGERLAAEGSEALAAALRAHSDVAHADQGLTDEWIAEMVERQSTRPTWDGQIRELPGPIEVRPLNAECGPDFFGFFEGEGFMDNPDWASCYCMYYHLNLSGEEWNRRTAEQNRADKQVLIETGEAQGYLAYAGERVVGWCHAAPRDSLRLLDDLPSAVPEGERTGAIVCFVVAAPYRRQGVSRALLEAACQGLREQGFQWVEAAPVREAKSDARAYHGPLELYRSAGFEEVQESGPFVLVRKALA